MKTVAVTEPYILKNLCKFLGKTEAEVVAASLCLMSAVSMPIEMRENLLEHEIDEGLKELGNG